MLRKIRLTLATLFFALITLLFLDFTGTIHAWFGWLAKIQFLPALLALNVGVFAGYSLASLWRSDSVCDFVGCRNTFGSCFTGALQCLWTYRKQHVFTGLSMG